jgi:hypothetical protein
MPEQTTAMSADTTADRHGDSRPAVTLLAVIAAWYVVTFGVVLSQAL